MTGGGEINYGTFLTSRMGVRVTQDFPEVFAPDTNILGVPGAQYPQTRREQRAKAYEKWVKWRDNMEQTPDENIGHSFSENDSHDDFDDNEDKEHESEEDEFLGEITHEGNKIQLMRNE